MRWARGLVAAGIVFFIIFCYTIPVSLIASLANLEELSQMKGMTWLEPVAEFNPKFTAFLQGFVPPLALSIFFSLVPTFMVMVSRMECLPSESDAQTSAIWVRACLRACFCLPAWRKGVHACIRKGAGVVDGTAD
jgi:calcium permeable stress-gated cation channel